MRKSPLLMPEQGAAQTDVQPPGKTRSRAGVGIAAGAGQRNAVPGRERDVEAAVGRVVRVMARGT